MLPSYTVAVVDAEATCGAGDCTPSPDLVIHASACLNGQVQGPSGESIAGATVTGTLDSSFGLEEVTADTDESGAYCLEVPPGAAVVLRASTEFGGLPVDSTEAIAAARSTPASCGSANCASAGLLQFAMLQCVTERGARPQTSVVFVQPCVRGRRQTAEFAEDTRTVPIQEIPADADTW
jgi:hypothetical protein